MYVYIYIYACMYAYVYIYRPCMYAYIYVCMYVRMYVCMRACKYKYKYIYIVMCKYDITIMYVYLRRHDMVCVYIVTHTYTHLRIWCTGLFGNREPQIRWSIIICPVKRALHSGWFPNFHSHILFRDISLLKSHPYPTKKIALHHKIAAPAKPHVLPPEGPDQNELPKPCRKAMFSFHKINIGYPCILWLQPNRETLKLDLHDWRLGPKAGWFNNHSLGHSVDATTSSTLYNCWGFIYCPVSYNCRIKYPMYSWVITMVSDHKQQGTSKYMYIYIYT